MKIVRINNVSIPLNKVDAINLVPSCIVKDAEGKDVNQKAKVCVLVGMTNVSADIDKDEDAKEFYDGVVKLIEENL